MECDFAYACATTNGPGTWVLRFFFLLSSFHAVCILFHGSLCFITYHICQRTHGKDRISNMAMGEELS